MRGRALGRDGKGLANRVPGHITDVLAQHEAEDALRLMADAFGSTRDAVALFDARRPAARRAAGALGLRPVPRCVALGSGDTAVRSAAQVLQAALADRFQRGSHALCITPTLGAVLAPQLAVKPLPNQLLQPGLASQWRQACRRHGIAPAGWRCNGPNRRWCTTGPRSSRCFTGCAATGFRSRPMLVDDWRQLLRDAGSQPPILPGRGPGPGRRIRGWR